MPQRDMEKCARTGEKEVTGTNCGRGGSECSEGQRCDIHPTDAWAVCCELEAPSGGQRCDLPGEQEVEGTNCAVGRGGAFCATGERCHSSTNEWAVCCKNGDLRWSHKQQQWLHPNPTVTSECQGKCVVNLAASIFALNPAKDGPPSEEWDETHPLKHVKAGCLRQIKEDCADSRSCTWTEDCEPEPPEQLACVSFDYGSTMTECCHACEIVVNTDQCVDPADKIRGGKQLYKGITCAEALELHKNAQIEKVALRPPPASLPLVSLPLQPPSSPPPVSSLSQLSNSPSSTSLDKLPGPSCQQCPTRQRSILFSTFFSHLPCCKGREAN